MATKIAKTVGKKTQSSSVSSSSNASVATKASATSGKLTPQELLAKIKANRSKSLSETKTRMVMPKDGLYTLLSVELKTNKQECKYIVFEFENAISKTIYRQSFTPFSPSATTGELKTLRYLFESQGFDWQNHEAFEPLRDLETYFIEEDGAILEAVGIEKALAIKNSYAKNGIYLDARRATEDSSVPASEAIYYFESFDGDNVVQLMYDIIVGSEIAPASGDKFEDKNSYLQYNLEFRSKTKENGRESFSIKFIGHPEDAEDKSSSDEDYSVFAD